MSRDRKSYEVTGHELLRENRQPRTIRDHSVQALRSLGSDHPPDRHFLRIEGDAIVLRFDRVTDAVRFADALGAESRRHGDATGLKDHFSYRFGMAFGHGKCATTSDVASCPEMSGLPFIWAARMESACSPGGIVLHESAWQQLCGEHSLPLDAPAPSENALLARFVAQTIQAKGDTYSAFVFAPPTTS